MSAPSMSRDEWLKALDEVGENIQVDPDAITTTAFMAMMNVDRQTASRQLKKLVATGKAVQVATRERASDGRMVRCNGYRLT